MLYAVILNAYIGKEIIGYSESQYLAKEYAKVFDELRGHYSISATTEVIPFRNMGELEKEFVSNIPNPLTGLKIITVTSNDGTMSGIVTKKKLVSFYDYYAQKLPKRIVRLNCTTVLLFFMLFGVIKDKKIIEPIKKLPRINDEKNIDIIKYELTTHEHGSITKM